MRHNILRRIEDTPESEITKLKRNLYISYDILFSYDSGKPLMVTGDMKRIDNTHVLFSNYIFRIDKELLRVEYDIEPFLKYIDDPNTLGEKVTDKIRFLRFSNDLIVLNRTEDNKLRILNENEFRAFGITKKAEGAFLIESIGLLFFNRNANKLEKLNVSNSNIKRLDESINFLNNITELNLRWNKLTELPDNFGNGLTNLKELYLYNNKLSTLPVNFGNGLTNLKYLDLKDNPLLPQDQINKLREKLPNTEIEYKTTLTFSE